MAPALIFALALLASDATAPSGPGEPLPPGAPTQDYALAGWCYGALGEYLQIYDKVKPDLIDIDRMFGSSVKNEKEPYAADIAAARIELTVIAGAIEAAEKASPQPIAPQGAQAIRLGQSIWRPAESKTRRELARAWLSWGMPDRCDSNARTLTAKARVLGKALTYNTAPASDTPPPAPESGAAPPAPGPLSSDAPAQSSPSPAPDEPPVATATPSPSSPNSQTSGQAAPQPAPAPSDESPPATPPPYPSEPPPDPML
jgi:hypothetical protein